MRLFVVCVPLLALVADTVVFAGVIGGDGGGGHFGGYSMSHNEHSGGDFGANFAFDEGHGMHNEIFDGSGEQHFGGDYGGGHGGFEFGGFNDGHESGMSHEDNAALSAVGLANLLSGGSIGGAHAHLASSGRSSYTISGPTQEIKSIHKISTTSTGGHVIGRTKGSAAEAPKFILVKNDAYIGGHSGSSGLAGGHGGYSGGQGDYSVGQGGYSVGQGGYSGAQGGYSGAQGGYSSGHSGYSGGHGGYSGGHGGYSGEDSASSSSHLELTGAHGALAGGRVDLSSGHGDQGGHEELSTGHEGQGGHAELPSGHVQGSSAHGVYGMGNSLGYGATFGAAKDAAGWHKA